MKEKIIEKPKYDNLLYQLVSLYKVFENTSNEDIKFNLSKLCWVSPFLILPISAYINDTKSELVNIEKCVSTKSYLEAIRFPKGVESISAFEEYLQKQKTFVPVSVLKRKNNIDRERLEQLFVDMIFNELNVGKLEGIKSAIFWPISELVTNIFDHSRKNEGYLFGQFYPKKNYLDICIVDRGRGLKKVYKEEKNLDFSDERSIRAVMEGTSTKPNKERGYGVWTSKKVVCEGLGGQFILLSGSSALVSMKNKEKIVSLPNFNWRGVIIAYRIPKPTKGLDMTKYYE